MRGDDKEVTRKHLHGEGDGQCGGKYGERTWRQESYHFLKRAACSPVEACRGQCERREGNEESEEAEEVSTEEGGKDEGLVWRRVHGMKLKRIQHQSRTWSGQLLPSREKEWWAAHRSNPLHLWATSHHNGGNPVLWAAMREESLVCWAFAKCQNVQRLWSKRVIAKIALLRRA